MSENHGLVGYSQDAAGTPGKSDEEVAQQEFDSIKPRGEERARDAQKDSEDATDSAYGPNQRSEAFEHTQKLPEDLGTENFAHKKKTVPESKYHPDYTNSEGTPKAHEYGKEVPANINPSSKEPNPGDYYGSTGGY